MKFALYLDEHQPQIVATRLTTAGYDVLTTQAAGLASKRTSDPDQLAFAADQQRAIVTSNAKHFYPLHRQWWDEGRHHSGIIIVSPGRLPPEVYQGILRLQELYPDGIDDLILQI